MVSNGAADVPGVSHVTSRKMPSSGEKRQDSIAPHSKTGRTRIMKSDAFHICTDYDFAISCYSNVQIAGGPAFHFLGIFYNPTFGKEDSSGRRSNHFAILEFSCIFLKTKYRKREMRSWLINHISANTEKKLFAL